MSKIIEVHEKRGMFKRTDALVVSPSTIIEAGKRIGVSKNNDIRQYVIGEPKKNN